MKPHAHRDARASAPQEPDRAAIGFIVALRRLYAGESFRIGLLLFDIATVLIFLLLTFVPPERWVIAVDATLGTLILIELTARGLVAHKRLAFLSKPSTLLDIVIIGSVLAPTLVGSFAFLRVLRAMRLFRAVRVVRDLRERHRWLIERGEMIGAATNLLVFIFITASIVYEAQAGRNPEINTFSDALYFTVSTLTTTGFGDITLTGESGRLLAVVVMVVGVSLFLKLAQAIIRPSKVHYSCPSCGLSRHDPDAVHCKHCGVVLNIPDEGA
jgi:voltage-gated potassium channel